MLFLPALILVLSAKRLAGNSISDMTYLLLIGTLNISSVNQSVYLTQTEQLYFVRGSLEVLEEDAAQFLWDYSTDGSLDKIFAVLSDMLLISALYFFRVTLWQKHLRTAQSQC